MGPGLLRGAGAGEKVIECIAGTRSGSEEANSATKAALGNGTTIRCDQLAPN